MTECINSWCTPSQIQPRCWDKILKRSRRHSHIAWEDANQASILPGSVVMHVCDNPRCINPKHLVLGTQRDNMLDKVAKGRHAEQKKTVCPKGHPLTQNGHHRVCKVCKRDAVRRFREKKHASS